MKELDIHLKHLSYTDRLSGRSADAVDLVVIHCTELPDLDTAREFGERIIYPDSATGNSGHFYIEQSGVIEEWVPVNRVAHHVRGYNERSIGIELDNRGRFPNWFDSRNQAMEESYPARQVAGLLNLLSFLDQDLPGLEWISGHEWLDSSKIPASDDPKIQVRRKVDPGPLFPWDAVLAQIRLKRFDPDFL